MHPLILFFFSSLRYHIMGLEMGSMVSLFFSFKKKNLLPFFVCDWGRKG